MQFVRPAVMWAMLAGIAGCTDHYTDVGMAYLGVATDDEFFSAEEPGFEVTFEAGKPLEVTVAHYCAAHMHPDHSCSVEQTDQGIMIHSELAYRRRTYQDICSEPALSHCVGPNLEVGTYAVSFADSTVDIDVPSSVAPPQLRGDPVDP